MSKLYVVGGVVISAAGLVSVLLTALLAPSFFNFIGFASEDPPATNVTPVNTTPPTTVQQPIAPATVAVVQPTPEPKPPVQKRIETAPPAQPPSVYWSALGHRLVNVENLRQEALNSLFGQSRMPEYPQTTFRESNDSAQIAQLNTTSIIKPSTTNSAVISDWATVSEQLLELEERRENLLIQLGEQLPRPVNNWATETATLVPEIEEAIGVGEEVGLQAFGMLNDLRIDGSLDTTETDESYVLILSDVVFETGRANLLPGAQHMLERVANFLRRLPNQAILVEGHTDNRGSKDYNLRLSKQRADAVREALVSRGIASQRIVTRGHGELLPIANNATDAGRQKNRRVEITVSR